MIQYVHCVASARSTATVQSSCGAPLRGDVGTMYQITCDPADQECVNQRCEALGARLPVN